MKKHLREFRDSERSMCGRWPGVSTFTKKAKATCKTCIKTKKVRSK